MIKTERSCLSKLERHLKFNLKLVIIIAGESCLHPFAKSSHYQLKYPSLEVEDHNYYGIFSGTEKAKQSSILQQNDLCEQNSKSHKKNYVSHQKCFLGKEKLVILKDLEEVHVSSPPLVHMH